MPIEKVEYRIRETKRYFVTRFEESDEGRSGSSSSFGEYDNADTAFAVGSALCKAEHERLGWPVGDERILYPVPVEEASQLGNGDASAVSLERVTFTPSFGYLGE